MILASFWDIIRVPFGYLMDILYRFTGNYGVSMILFAIIVKVIMLPIAAKSKRSSMKMSRISPQVKKIQEKYADNPQKQNEAMQQLYRDEGISLGGGCLWAFVPLLILIPLYSVVREPIVYMLHESRGEAKEIIRVIKEAAPELFGGNSYYHQMTAAANISQFAEQIKAAGIAVSERTLEGINFSFLGIDLSGVPSLNVFKWSAYDWAHIGAFLLPVLSAAGQVLSMIVAQKTNNSVITNENGVYDDEAAKESKANQTSKTMMWIMPLMSLWIGFSMPCAMSLYWFIQGLVSTVSDSIMTVHYRKIYDAEDAEKLKIAMERDRIEAEKEALRAARRAENPDGITTNTSKKKLQQAKRNEEAAAKAAAAREYAAQKGIAMEEAPAEKQTLSGVSDRPFCKGRAYDPNRYRNTEE